MEVVGQWINELCIITILLAVSLWMLSALLLKLPPKGRLQSIARQAVPFSLKPTIQMSCGSILFLTLLLLLLTRGKPLSDFSQQQTLPPFSFKLTETIEPDYRSKKSGKYLHLAVTSVKAAGLEILTGYSDNEGKGILMVVTPEEAEQVKQNLRLTPGQRFSFPGLPPQLLSEGAARYLRDHQISLLVQTINTVLRYFGINPFLLALMPLSLLLMTFGFLAFGNTLLHRGLRRNLARILEKQEELILAPPASIDTKKTWIKRLLPWAQRFFGRDNLEVIVVETKTGIWRGSVIVPRHADSANTSGRLLFIPSGIPMLGRHPLLLTDDLIDKVLLAPK